MPKLIILRGNSGSGKTVVSKELQKRFGKNTMLISQDMIRLQMLHAKDAEARPLEETLLRHNTKPNKADFGEKDMRRWWKEKDYINMIPEKIITKEKSLSDTVDMIYDMIVV